MQHFRGPGVIAIAAKEPLQRLYELRRMPGVVVLERPEILTTKGAQGIAVLNTRDDAVDTKIVKRDRLVSAEKLATDPHRLLRLGVGAHDRPRTHRAASKSNRGRSRPHERVDP